ncbi:MAG TPA: hypothetical protein VG457_11815, partial [Planctomycetota bacterium]|nr:hypothetical protein [Planctomycetota bacterium]
LDWIGLYVVGSDDSTEGLNPSSSLTWQYTGGATSGGLQFTASGTSGSYEFRYFLNNSATKVATSNTVTVGTTPPPTGGVIYAGQGGSLTTSEGTWTFGGVSPDGVDSYCLLNGVADGWAAQMEIVGGSLYALNTVNGNWYLRQNGTWIDTGTTAPSSGGTAPPPPSPSPAPPSSGTNLVQDPDFENQTATGGGPLVAPWEGDGPATIGVDGSNGMNGSKCGYIYDDGSGAVSLISQVLAVSPNTNYTLSCFVQTGSAFPAQGGMGVKDGNWNILGNQSFGQMSDYTQLTVTFNSGSNTSVWVYVGFEDQGPGAWIHVDNWSMK